MQHISVQFNTTTYGVKSSTRALRARCRKSPGFYRLLQAAAAAQLKGNPPTLQGSNPKATRALERAVCKVRRTMELDPKGHAARAAYLMRDGKAWTEVLKNTAVRAMHETMPDTLAVMKVWTFSESISHRAARKLERLTAPESISSLLDDAEVIAFKEDRSRSTDKRGDHAQTEAGELTPWDEENAEYNDAGELETRAEREEREQGERSAKEKAGVKLAREQAAAEGREFIPPTPRRSNPKPAPKFYEYVQVWERPVAPVSEPVTKALPEAPYYHATEARMSAAAQAELKAERETYQQRRTELDRDHNQQLELAELDEMLSPEDLESDMLEPWEAMERYAAAQ